MNPRPGSFWRLFLAVFAALLALAAALVGLVWWRGAQADAGLEATWRRALGGRSFLERYPPTEDNSTVLALEALGSEMGIEMAPAEVGERQHPTPEAARRFQAVLPALKAHLEPAACSEDGSLAAPPAEVAAYLAWARPTLERTAALLLRSPAPVWKSDLRRGFEAPIPNLLGNLNLQRLLVLEARERVRSGRTEAGLEMLEASWRLSQAVLDQPHLIGQLIGQAMLKLQIPVLRGLPRAPAAWRSRLAGIDLRRRMLLALQAEAFIAHRSASFDRPPGMDAPIRFWPVARWMMRDYARRFQPMIEELPARDVRSFDPEDFNREKTAELPRWQIVARILLPNFWEVWPRSAQAELNAELAALGLEERERRAAGAPPRATGSRPSRVDGLRWIYEETPEGTVIRLGGRLLHPGAKPLPTRLLVRR